MQASFTVFITLIKNHRLFLIVMICLFIGRLAISGQGYLEDSDEVDYYCSEDAFDALLHFKIIDFSRHISLTEGKPTEALFKTAQVPIHRIWAWAINSPRHSPSGLWILGFINILISLALLCVFYLLQRALNIRKNAATLGVALLGIFINFNLYTRHLLSYDTGLLFPMLSLLVLIRPVADERKKLLLAGFLAALGFTSYHGHFMMYAIIGGWLLLLPPSQSFNFRSRIITMAMGFVPLLIIYEMFFWIGGNSFFIENLKIGGTINQGAYTDGFIFAPLYLYQIEGFAGIVLLALFLLSVFFALREKSTAPAQKLLFLAIASYLVYGFAVFALHFFVFYGRIFHLYYPFMVLGVIVLFEKWKVTRNIYFHAVCYALLAIQYFFNIQDMNSFTYPRKVIDSFGLADYNNGRVEKQFFYELRCSENYINNHRFLQYGACPNKLNEGTYEISNTCFFNHYPDFFLNTFNQHHFADGKSVYSKLHFMSHPAYTFEYCSAYGREFFREKQFHISIIKKE